MKKQKSWIRRLIVWLMVVAALACLVIFVGIPLYGTQDEATIEKPVIAYYDGGKSKITMENDALTFEMDPTTTQFAVTEKASGRVWRSNPENPAKDPIAVSTNKAVLQSTMIVTYSSASGTIDYNNYTYSIENGSYTIDQKDDEVRVQYSVGKIERTYRIPTAITSERFNAFMDALSSKDAKKVKNVYTLYKPDKVATMDNRDELLALYPELENQELYVLRSDTSTANKAKMEGYFADAGYTEEDYELDMQLVAGENNKLAQVFNVTVVYRLDGGDFVVEVPYDEIRYNSDYPITYVTVLPMFGAAGTDEEGFILVPEGGGALIRYNNGKLSQNSYYANMYGWDYGTERREVVSETKSTFPVFGMTQSGGSFLCMIEGASSYAGVQADISMRYNSYNYCNAKYNVLHSDRYNVSAKTAKLVYMFEKSIPEDTIVQRYRFLDTEDPNVMAAAYGDYLRERYPSLMATDVADTVPVSVELVGAIDKRVVKFGMPVNSVVATTSFAQAQKILSDLRSSGVQAFSARMSGWSNGGVSQKVLTSVRVEKELGGEKGMTQLIESAKQLNIPLYFDGVSVFAYRSSIFRGFLAFRDAARFTTREQIKIYPYSVIWYQSDDSQDPYYLVHPSFARNCAENLISALAQRNAAGVAFRDIGYLLSGDYDQTNTTTREQVKQMQIDLVKEAKDQGENVMIKEGYDYVMPYVDFITDMDLNGIEYSILDDTIPFYQMAIHGSVDYTGLPINLASDWQTEFLRCVEYGAGLNFTFMAADAKIVQETNYSCYYGASYGDWGEKAKELIVDYQKHMQGVNSERMIGHETLAKGVTVTRYADGTHVYVNYGSQPYEMDDLQVPARGYTVTGGETK